MGLLYDMETRLEPQIPAQLQRSLPQALDDCRPICGGGNLAMHRHHHYARTITARYGPSDCRCRCSAAGSAGGGPAA